MTETFGEGNVDKGIQTGPQQVDNFSKELSDFLLDEKLTNKEEISNLLVSNPDLKTGFEEFLRTANLRQKIKCKKELQNCSTAEEIKSIIVENLPEGYKVGNSELGNTEISEVTVEDKAFLNVTKQIDQGMVETLKKQESLVEHELLRKSIQERDNLLKNLENRDKKKAEELDEKTREKTRQAKQKLSEETKRQLEENDYDENFIDDYLLVKVTLNEVKNDSSFSQTDIANFEKSVGDLDKGFKLSGFDVILKNIDNACNIPDTSLDSFSSENIAQTRTELFSKDVGNDSLISAKKSNMESRDYSKVFHEMNDEELISEYGHLLEGNLKEFYRQYQNNPEDINNKLNDLKNNPNPTEEETQLIKNYQDMVAELKNIKETAENETKNLMEELCLISQVKGLSMCIGQEGGNDFNFNKANEIQNDNGVLTLNGHIDGVDFSVRQDTNNPEARLQTTSKLGVSVDKNTFTLGSGKQFIDSPFILPSQTEIFKIITQEVQSDVNDLKKSDNLASYFENLQQNIMGRMDNVYKDAELAHHYITNKVKGEKIVDNSISLLQGIKPDIKLDESINQGTNPKLHSFIKIINFNIENSTTGEKDKLNQILSKIEEVKNNYRNNNGRETFDSVKYPPIIENYLKNETRLKDGNEESKIGLISDLFDFYSKNSNDVRSSSEGTEGAPSKMIINDLYRDLFESSNDNKESQQSLVSKQRNDNNNNLVASIDSGDFNRPSDGYSSQTVVESGTSVA